MRYFKLNRVVTETTTLGIICGENEDNYMYQRDGDIEYWGVDTDDTNFLQKQHPECNMQELTFEETRSVLERCKLMKDVDSLIEQEIAKRYSIPEEIGLTNGDHKAPEYADYRAYVEECKNKFLPLKQKYGLVQL